VWIHHTRWSARAGRSLIGDTIAKVADEKLK
jgi:hypothetical protein